MKMQAIRQMAKELGINSFGKSKIALVREIQRKQGNFDCFATAVDYCDQQQCCFKAVCFVEAKKTVRRR